MKSWCKANITTFRWWEYHRLKYNRALILAGFGAFICMVMVYFIFSDKMGHDDEITLFTIAFQSIAYLIAIGIANICYYIGPISETIIKPHDVRQYRRITYGMGFWGSVALPFSIPAIMLFSCLFIS